VGLIRERSHLLAVQRPSAVGIGERNERLVARLLARRERQIPRWRVCDKAVAAQRSTARVQGFADRGVQPRDTREMRATLSA
jgi:hypothetical protein